MFAPPPTPPTTTATPPFSPLPPSISRHGAQSIKMRPPPPSLPTIAEKKWQVTPRARNSPPPPRPRASSLLNSLHSPKIISSSFFLDTDTGATCCFAKRSSKCPHHGQRAHRPIVQTMQSGTFAFFPYVCTSIILPNSSSNHTTQSQLIRAYTIM